jgi:hypothetical protein
MRMAYTNRSALAVIPLLLISFSRLVPVRAQSAPAEPALVKKIAAAHWRFARAKAALPPVQVVQEERLEIQDFVQYAFEGGALRLCVSPGRKGGAIFALLVDTRVPRYANFAQLASTGRYATYHHGEYAAVVPLQPVSQQLFDKLKASQWTKAELQQQLGSPSYNWHVHGAGYLGVTYVVPGLSFIGDQGGPGAVVKYQVHAEAVEAKWGEEHKFEFRLPSLEALSQLDYSTLQQECREEFANRLLNQREQIDQALANGKRSPNGRYTAGTVNFGGVSYTGELIVRETGKPEQRYSAATTEYLWLNGRTILFKMGWADGEAFQTMDALTGATSVVASIPDKSSSFLGDPQVADFGVSDPQRFWYTTKDGERHEVTVHHQARPPK